MNIKNLSKNLFYACSLLLWTFVNGMWPKVVTIFFGAVFYISLVIAFRKSIKQGLTFRQTISHLLSDLIFAILTIILVIIIMIIKFG